MAASSTPIKGFTFGIEIEIYLQPKKDKVVSDLLADHGWTFGDGLERNQINGNKEALLKTVAAIVTTAGLTAIVPKDDLANEYREWQVKSDGSLYELPKKVGFMGVELVSPIMKAEEDIWSRELVRIFDALASAFDLEVNAACSTHVHIKPAGGWTSTDIRFLFKATAVFDDAITRIMPASRKQTPWARSNFHELSSSDPKEAQQIPKLYPAERNLVTFFDKMKKSSRTWQHLFDHFDKTIKTKDDTMRFADTRGVSMNFLSIQSNCETVEFRRPPGVATAQEARRWAAFALAFVAASLDPDSGWDEQWSSAKGDATVINLQQFIGKGLLRLSRLTGNTGWKSEVRPSSFVEDKSAPYTMSMYGPGVIQAKLKKAMNRLSSFETKVSTSRVNRSRSNSSASSRDNSPHRGATATKMAGPISAAGAVKATSRPNTPPSRALSGAANTGTAKTTSRPDTPPTRALPGAASTGTGTGKATGGSKAAGAPSRPLPVGSHRKE